PAGPARAPVSFIPGARTTLPGSLKSPPPTTTTVWSVCGGSDPPAGGVSRRRYIAVLAAGAWTLMLLGAGRQNGPAAFTVTITSYGPGRSASKVVSTSPFEDVGTDPLGPVTCHVMVGKPKTPLKLAWAWMRTGATGLIGVSVTEMRHTEASPWGPASG